MTREYPHPVLKSIGVGGGLWGGIVSSLVLWQGIWIFIGLTLFFATAALAAYLDIYVDQQRERVQ